MKYQASPRTKFQNSQLPNVLRRRRSKISERASEVRKYLNTATCKLPRSRFFNPIVWQLKNSKFAKYSPSSSNDENSKVSHDMLQDLRVTQSAKKLSKIFRHVRS